MASNIKSHHFYVAISPYKVDGHEDEFNELDVMTTYDDRHKHFYVCLHAGWRTGYGHGCMLYGGQGWLSDSQFVIVKDAPRNSQKTINEIGAALELAREDIAYLFDKRKWELLNSLVKNVALYGYTADIEVKMRDVKQAEETINNNSSTNQNNETTMAKNETTNAQQYVGKVIIVGDDIATIEIKGVQDNGMLDGEFKKGDYVTKMPVTIPNLEGMIAKGVWKFKGEQPATATDDVQEVEDVQPKKPEPKAKEVKMEPKSKSKPKSEKKSEPKAETKAETKADTEPKGGLTYETYQNKKGKTCAKIKGFAETDAAYKEAESLHGSASWDNTKKGKVLFVAFGPRYADAAKAVCDALNAGKSLADCKAIIDGATAERAEKRAEWKAKREEHKAAAAEPKAKTYTEAEVADLIRRVVAGDQAAIDEVNAMAKKAA